MTKARESLFPARRLTPPTTFVTLTVEIPHPEFVGDGDDERIAIENLMRTVRNEAWRVCVVDVTTVPGERG